MTLRVRFAPCPTGYLHVGGARTALFNWLWAQKNRRHLHPPHRGHRQGALDEAKTRSILEGLEWLGLQWDEGPFLQSDGVARHREVAHRLLAEGKAYRSFATSEELDAQRKAADAAKRPWLRDQASRDLSHAESQQRADAGSAFTIRFRVPDGEGETSFEDRVYGTQSRRYADIEDFALLRPDGSPLYNHVVVCDDIEMAITFVIRGQDHISNTHKQILLYEALDRQPPAFAHLPLINAPDRTKLSKRRHGPVVSLTTYRDRGILPEAFRNFLALIGWSPGDRPGDVHHRRADPGVLVRGRSRAPTPSSTSPRPTRGSGPTARRSSSTSSTCRRCRSRTCCRKWSRCCAAPTCGKRRWAAGGAERSWFSGAVDLIRQRFITLLDFAGPGRAYFSDTFDMEEDAVAKNLRKEPRLAGWLPELAKRFEALPAWEHDALEAALRGFADELAVKAGVLINAARTAVTGNSVGPSLFDVLLCLGRERVVARLRAAAERLA